MFFIMDISVHENGWYAKDLYGIRSIAVVSCSVTMRKQKKTSPRRPVGRPPTHKLRIVLKLCAEINEELGTAAIATGLTKSDFVTQAIKEKIARGIR
jgi:hypothetical protein